MRRGRDEELAQAESRALAPQMPDYLTLPGEDVRRGGGMADVALPRAVRAARVRADRRALRERVDGCVGRLGDGRAARWRRRRASRSRSRPTTCRSRFPRNAGRSTGGDFRKLITGGDDYVVLFTAPRDAARRHRGGGRRSALRLDADRRGGSGQGVRWSIATGARAFPFRTRAIATSSAVNLSLTNVADAPAHEKQPRHRPRDRRRHDRVDAAGGARRNASGGRRRWRKEKAKTEEGAATSARSMDAPYLAVPVVRDGQLVNYLFVSIRIEIAPGVDLWRTRERAHFLRDALVRASHANELADPERQQRPERGARHRGVPGGRGPGAGRAGGRGDHDRRHLFEPGVRHLTSARLACATRVHCGM